MIFTDHSFRIVQQVNKKKERSQEQQKTKQYNQINQTTQMNVNRFLLILNHEDPDVVSAGLKDFQAQILTENHAVDSFGYCGCSLSLKPVNLFEKNNYNIIGLMKLYLNTSPNLEELFVLWSLPGHDEDLNLCAQHMACIAAVLHCTVSDQDLCNDIVRRILHEFFRSVRSQLSSGNTELVHSALSLLIAMSRTSAQNCRDTCQKFADFSFGSIIQKNKSITWTDSATMTFKTDTRMLLTTLQLLFVESAQQDEVSQLLMSSSTFKRLIHSIDKDLPGTIVIILDAFKYLIQHSHTFRAHINEFLDTILTEKLFMLYRSEEESMRDTVHLFFVTVCQYLGGAIKMKKNNGNEDQAAVAASLCVNQMLKKIKAVVDDNHKELHKILLAAQPSLLSKCINIQGFSWEPRLDNFYIDTITYVTDLLSTVVISDKCKSSLLGFLKANGDVQSAAGNSTSVRSGLDDIIVNMIPAGFTKKEMLKLVTHANSTLQFCGISFVSAVIQRLSKIFSDAGVNRHSYSDRLISAAIFKYLPDFQVLMNVRSKLSKFDLNALEIALDEPINNETEAMVMEDNFDFNFGEESEVDFQVNEQVKTPIVDPQEILKKDILHVLMAVLQTMEIYISLLPSILAQSSGDLLRMLDDFVQWPAELTVLAAGKNLSLVDVGVLGCIIRLLRQATLGGFCKWFGSPDDNVKQLTQLIVSDSWACSLKRSHLAKLVLICVASVDDNVANKAISLLKSVLLTSGMFDGHGVVDSELYCELQGWCDLLLRYGRDEDLGDAMLLITSVMQISFHWNGTLSSSFLSGFQSDSYSLKKINSSETSDVLLPFSPMMYCCVSWIGNNFVVFESEMPNYIRSYMESITVGENKVKSLEDCEVFFRKFRHKVSLLVESALVEVVFSVAKNSHHPVKYLTCLKQVLVNVDINVPASGKINFKNVSNLQQEVSNIEVLLESSSLNVTNVKRKTSVKTDRSGKEKEGVIFHGISTLDSFLQSSYVNEKFSPSTLCAALAINLNSIVSSPIFSRPSDELSSHFVFVFMEKHWHSIVLAYLKSNNLEYVDEVMVWTSRHWEIDSTTKLGGMHQNSLLLTESLRLLHALSDNTAVNFDTAVSKKRKIEDNLQASHSLSECTRLGEVVVKKLSWLVQNNESNPHFLSELENSRLLTHFLDDNLFGLRCREILQYAAMASVSKCPVGKQNLLWRRVSDEISAWREVNGSSLSDESYLQLHRLSVACLNGDGELNGEVRTTDMQQLLLSAELLSSGDKFITPSASFVNTFLSQSSFSEISNAFSSYFSASWSSDDAEEVHQNLSALSSPSFSCSTSSLMNSSTFFDPLSVVNVPMALMGMFRDLKDVDLAERIMCSHCPQILQKLMSDASIVSNDQTSENSSHQLKLYILALCNGALSKQVSISDMDANTARDNSSFVSDCITSRLENDKPYSSALKAFFAHLKLLAQVEEGGQDIMNLHLSTYVRSTPFNRRKSLLSGQYLSLIHDSLPSQQVDLQVSWLLAFTSVTQYYLKASSVAIAELSQDAENSKSSLKNTDLDALLTRVRSLIGCSEIFEFSEDPIAVKARVTARASLTSMMNKWVRSCLRHGFRQNSVLSFLTELISVWNRLSCSENSIWYSIVAQPGDTDFFSSQTLLSMIVGHSMFQEVILDQSHSKKDAATGSLLSLVLTLVSHIHCSDAKHSKKNEDKNHYLANVLLSRYSATMSHNDRITLRILSILEFVGLSPSLRGAPFRSKRDGNILPIRSSGWVFETFSPPIVYATLARFPIWRSVVPSPALFESDVGLFQRQLEDALVDDESLDKGAHNVASARDELLQCHEDVYDPCFFVPAIFNTLENYELSIRQLANCGALSLILASVSSSCSTVRSYALASLQLVYGMLKKQTPEKDPAFRERTQILLLVGFVKTSIDGVKAVEKSRSVPEVSLTMGIFLGRAAMNLMQPNHKMFCKVNKYLLSRPYCDPKDVPLFDLLVVNADTQVDQAEMLIALRLVRDGLLTPVDHLNLCRKNAYNRLMLLYPLLVADTRIGHSILDIIERGLVVRLSARYLIERCNLLTWLQSMASPVVNLKLTARFLNNASASKDPHNGNFSKYLIRYMHIFRRWIWALSLMLEESECSLLLIDVRLALTSIVEDIILGCNNGHASLIPLDVFRYVVLSMWDVTLLEQEQSVVDQQWSFDLIERLSSCLDGLVSKADATERDEINFSLLSLLSFNQASEDLSSMSSALVTRFVDLSCQFLLPENFVPDITFVLVDNNDVFKSGEKEPAYFNVSKYKKTLSVHHKEASQHDQLERVWSFYGKTTDNMNMCLPTTLGNRFQLSCYLQVSNLSKSNLENALTEVNRDLILWSLFLRRGALWTPKDESPDTLALIQSVMLSSKVSGSSVDAILRLQLCSRLLTTVSRIRSQLLSWLTIELCDAVMRTYYQIAVTFQLTNSQSVSEELVFDVVSHLSALISFHSRMSEGDKNFTSNADFAVHNMQARTELLDVAHKRILTQPACPSVFSSDPLIWENFGSKFSDSKQVCSLIESGSDTVSWKRNVHVSSDSQQLTPCGPLDSVLSIENESNNEDGDEEEQDEDEDLEMDEDESDDDFSVDSVL